MPSLLRIHVGHHQNAHNFVFIEMQCIFSFLLRGLIRLFILIGHLHLSRMWLAWIYAQNPTMHVFKRHWTTCLKSTNQGGPIFILDLLWVKLSKTCWGHCNLQVPRALYPCVLEIVRLHFITRWTNFFICHNGLLTKLCMVSTCFVNYERWLIGIMKKTLKKIQFFWHPFQEWLGVKNNCTHYVMLTLCIVQTLS